MTTFEETDELIESRQFCDFGFRHSGTTALGKFEDVKSVMLFAVLTADVQAKGLTK